MVPTGKETPIEPAEKLPSTAVVPSARELPAPVHEYTYENPEPPPLDPSYVPIRFDYIQYLSPHAIVYVSTKYKNHIKLRIQSIIHLHHKNQKT